MGCDFKGDCSACQGSYGPIADAFILVPDNFNSVTNFVPKLPVYRSLQVCDIATENGANARAGKCCDAKDAQEYEGDGCCGQKNECESFGFIRYPLTIRPTAVQVCGKVGCVCSKGVNHLADGAERNLNSCCGKSGCVEDNELGFLNWPPVGYFKSVKACGPIDSQICCKKHKRKGCVKCKVVAGPCRDKCGRKHSKSSSSSHWSSFTKTK